MAPGNEDAAPPKEAGKSQRSSSAPARGLDDAQAFKASTQMPPSFTMRPKVSFGSQFKNSKQADEGGMAGDLGPKLNEIRAKAPSWSFMPRESGITKTKEQPGPGQYPIPSTIYGSHPALPVAGRVPNRSEKRSVPADQLGAEMKNNPAPHDYEVVKTVDGPDHKFGHAGQKTAPKFTMREKVSFGSQFKNAKQADEGGMAGDLGSKYNEIRPRAPSWSFMPRESGITKTKEQPGPGQYPIPSTIYGEHPQLPVAGRVPKQVEKRSTPADQLIGMQKNPSPQDYAVVSSPGPNHKFGRADQESAPKFTMRAKVSFGSQFKNSKQADEGGMAGDLGPKLNEIRAKAPSWSFMPRESGITKTKEQPGPGQYPQPSTLYGAHPQLKVPGRVPKSTVERFPDVKEKDMRPY